MLTDEQIFDILISSDNGQEPKQLAFDACRAIESAACADRDARIAELEHEVRELRMSRVLRNDQYERQLAEAQKDAERYRWLRKQHWSENLIGVVVRPKDQTKLGSLSPSLELLDDTIDHMKSNENAVQKGQS